MQEEHGMWRIERVFCLIRWRVEFIRQGILQAGLLSYRILRERVWNNNNTKVVNNFNSTDKKNTNTSIESIHILLKCLVPSFLDFYKCSSQCPLPRSHLTYGFQSSSSHCFLFDLGSCLSNSQLNITSYWGPPDISNTLHLAKLCQP